MPVVIGAKPESGFRDPLGLLTDRHRRVEKFLSVLVQVIAQAQGGPLSGELRAALDTALRYFREAAPKHMAANHFRENGLVPRGIWHSHAGMPVFHWRKPRPKSGSLEKDPDRKANEGRSL